MAPFLNINSGNVFAFLTITSLAFSIPPSLALSNTAHRKIMTISAKKLLKLARKWQKLAAINRKRIAVPQADGIAEINSCSTSTKTEKGHFVVYSADQKRFVLPLQYLNNEMMRELFNMAEEEFGLCSDGRLTLPCEAELMEYAFALIKQKVNEDVEKALLTSIASSCSSLHLQHESTFHQLPICSF